MLTSINEWNNNITENNTTVNKTYLDNSTCERNALNSNNNNINQEVEKWRQLNYQIYRLQQLSIYYETSTNQKRPYVPAKFRQK